jgi:nucleotide-binding universal stress UspA family protein
MTQILVAADDSQAGLHAVEVAETLARMAGADLSVCTVVESTGVEMPAPLARRQPRVARGVPGVEIVRQAEELHADLLVIGRAAGPDGERPVLGVTGDAVVRRSLVPCLFVPPTHTGIGRVVVALDGTERGFGVLDWARRMLRITGGEALAITVEPADIGGLPGEPVLTARSLRVSQALRAGGETACWPLLVRQGEPAAAIRAELTSPHSDLLVVGTRRGGPGGPPVSTGVGRMLIHTAPTAVLTVPL